MWRLLIYITLWICLISYMVANENKTLTLGYLIPWTEEWEVGPLMGSGFLVGLESVKERGLLPGYDIQWTWRDTQCKPLQGIKMAVDIWYQVDDLDGIIGDGCSVICQPVSLLASSWGIPVISWACASAKLSDKTIYPTFSRVVGPWTLLAPMFNALADRFNWTRVGIITDTADIMQTTAEATKNYMEQKGKEVYFYTIETTVNGNDINPEALEKQQTIVRTIKTEVRVVFMLLIGNDFRNFLVSAYDENMLTPEYAYVAMDVAHMINIPATYRPEVNPFIFEGVIIGTPNKPSGPEWDHFTERVIRAFNDEAFRGQRHLPSSASAADVEVHAGMVHDAVLMWAYGVNKTLEQGYAPDDGFKITPNIFNMTFEGITGTVAIDERGDRQADYKLQIVQNGEMQSLLNWKAATKTLVKIHKPYDEYDWSGVIWPGNGSAPPNGSPACGWNNELCLVEHPNSTMIVIISASVAGLLILILAVIAIYAIRKLKYEAELKEATSCCFNWNEMLVDAKMACSKITLNSVCSGSTALPGAFVRLVRVNNEVAAMKELGQGTISVMDRCVLVEIKIMKDIKHENVNAFIGVCLEQPHACVLMSYAARGSLQDVLSDASISLNWDFKISILTDIAQGMKYLHMSQIGSHGHLKSSNCLVDSRWICKINDYGLSYIKSTTRTMIKEGVNLASFLWTAPELLRTDKIPIVGTQKGDVFSFAIIAQEIVLEDDPYAANIPKLDAQSIISQVKHCTGKPYRPEIPNDACNDAWSDLIGKCWREEPESRPTFSKILELIRSTNGGKIVSLVDSMVLRLEKHTRYLEDTIVDRTSALMEEKMKMEHLLQELLPTCVSENLKLGKTMAPESFDSVTILFSDIVGFTRISAAGNPLDVVKMLNLTYTVFDDISNKYDVYKVATIGDAYFVASGVPVRNGDQHAIEIANLALDLLKRTEHLSIPHLPGENIKMRIGINSGPCVAGVAGIKMPRYMLFGDTVALASAIEACGESMHIHTSQATASILEKSGIFHLSLRGDVLIKGCINTTFWLTGKVQQ